MELLEGSRTRQLDELLVAFVRAPEPEAREALGRLLTVEARPVIRRILRLRLGASPEAHDLEGEIVLRLIERLQRLRFDPGDEGIHDFRGYVAVAAYNALAERGWRGERSRSRSDDEALGNLPDGRPDAASALERRADLVRLWAEIRRLPARQATALLLNLRDDRRRDAMALLPLTGIATLREIAHTMAMPAERLAEIWNRLPLEDRAIADLLGLTRQQVINLRKSARERLARRLRS